MFNVIELLTATLFTANQPNAAPSDQEQCWSQISQVTPCYSSTQNFMCSVSNLSLENQVKSKISHLNATPTPAAVIATSAIEKKAKPTSIPTPIPTNIPIPTIKVNEPVETPTPAVSDGGLDPEKIFNLVNNHRQNLGLTPLIKDERLCQIAAQRQPEISLEIQRGTIHAGLAAKNPGYRITENMIHQDSEEAALSWWLSSSLHRRAIESTQHTAACSACSGNTCIQLFSSFQSL